MAARGSTTAEQKLAGPRLPEELAYLRGWLYEVHGRSGVGMGGLAPLSYSTIESWARLKDVTIDPHEIDALIMLDAVLLSPTTDDENASGDTAEAKRARADHTTRAERLARRQR